MTMPKIIVALLLVIPAFALLSLVSGASYLETMLPGGLPIGNALTAIGLCAAAGSAVGLSARRTALRLVSVASLIGAAAWLPASIALAGNLTLNFDGDRGVAWLALSLAIVAAVLGTLAWALVASFLAMHRRAGAA
jgi:hypothetical protein